MLSRDDLKYLVVCTQGISPGCSLEGLMLKLKLQYFGHLMQRADSFEKTLMLGKIEGRRRRGRQRMSWLDGITDSMDVGWVDSGSWWWTGRPGVLQFMGSQSRTRLSDWTEYVYKIFILSVVKHLISATGKAWTQIFSHKTQCFSWVYTLTRLWLLCDIRWNISNSCEFSHSSPRQG